MKYLVAIALVLAVVSQTLKDDEVENPPGMPNSSKLYSGYLDTLSSTRKLHYVLVESQNNPETDPLVLWLNGGPGCSSLLGFLQEIGSYTIETSYVNGSNLIRNDYAWTKAANILYLESPAGVGFSTNSEANYAHNDTTTVNDAYAALKSFLQVKGAAWVKNPFFITGESYAGKYIPDLVVKILDNNAAFYINITGIMVGNGVMSFLDHSLDKSRVDYMYTHNFINPVMMGMYKESCLVDYFSPRCNLFKVEFNRADAGLNPYNVYEVCQKQSSEASTLLNRLNQSRQSTSGLFASVGQIANCPNEIGLIDYLNTHQQKYHITQKISWDSCANIHYDIDPAGSIAQYKRILSNGNVRVWLYSGDSDDVVPFTDTEKNLESLGVYAKQDWTPWVVGEDHAGFYQYYTGLMIATVKGAGHMVPQNKRKAAYQMFYNFLNNRGINTPV